MTAWVWAASSAAPVYLDVPRSLDAVGRQDAGGATKITEDLTRYTAVLEQSKPDVIVECGSWRGGSALWFARQGYDIITIDIDGSLISQSARTHSRITCITGDSVQESVYASIVEATAGKRVMVVLDSDHDPAHVKREIDLYGPLVSADCYLVVEDGILRWMGPSSEQSYPGPLDAIELTLMADVRWVRDLDVENMSPVTLHPAGWWRRAR